MRELLLDAIMATVPEPERFSERQLAEIRRTVAHVLEESPRWVDDFGDVTVLGLDGMVFRPEVFDP